MAAVSIWVMMRAVGYGAGGGRGVFTKAWDGAQERVCIARVRNGRSFFFTVCVVMVQAHAINVVMIVVVMIVATTHGAIVVHNRPAR